MKTILVLFISILCTFALDMAQAQGTNTTATLMTPAKKLPEKYNGYGLKNTKLQKTISQTTPKKKSKKINPDTLLPAPQTAFVAEPQLAVTPVITPKEPLPVTPEEPAKKNYKFAAEVFFLYERQAEKLNDGTQPQGLGLEVDPRVTMYDISLYGKFYYIYSLDHPGQQNDWDDPTIGLHYRGWHIISAVRFAPKIYVNLPWSKESRENREFRSINNVGFDLKLNSKYLNIEKFFFSYSAAYGFFDNKFSTRTNGEPATKSKILQIVKTGYNFNPITFTFSFEFTSNYSYDDVVRNSFLMYEMLSYQFTEKIGASFYHYNKAALLRPGTYENNLNVYDKDTSTLGLSLDLYL